MPNHTTPAIAKVHTQTMTFGQAFERLNDHATEHDWGHFEQRYLKPMLSQLAHARLLGWQADQRLAYAQWKLKLEHALALDGQDLHALWTDPPMILAYQPNILIIRERKFGSILNFNGVHLINVHAKLQLEIEDNELLIIGSLHHPNHQLVAETLLEHYAISPNMTLQIQTLTQHLEWLLDSSRILGVLEPEYECLARLRLGKLQPQPKSLAYAS